MNKKLVLYNNYSNPQNKKIFFIKKKKNIKLVLKNYINFSKFSYKYFYIKRWFISFISVFSKKGKDQKYIKYLNKTFKKIEKKYNLFKFFLKIENNLFIFFSFFKKKIAGKNLFIPLGLSEHKRINIISKFIVNSLISRKEKNFIEKLFNELEDIYNNKGLTINKRLEYIRQMRENIVNIRYLNEKY